MNELTVILPAYNEAANVDVLVERWQKQCDILTEKYSLSLQIVIVNDGSTDRTQAISESLERKHQNVKLLNHTENKGLGMAVKTGITYILENCPDSLYVCLMDCDNTQSPKYVLDMLNKAVTSELGPMADVVIASRFQIGSKVNGLSWHRLLISEAAKNVYSALLHIDGVRDYTCGYRLYSRDILEKAYSQFGDRIIEEKGFTCMTELLYKLYFMNARIVEIPFELRYDFKRGQSKMKVAKTTINSIKLAFELRKLKYVTQKDVQYEYIKK